MYPIDIYSVQLTESTENLFNLLLNDFRFETKLAAILEAARRHVSSRPPFDGRKNIHFETEDCLFRDPEMMRSMTDDNLINLNNVRHICINHNFIFVVTAIVQYFRPW